MPTSPPVSGRVKGFARLDPVDLARALAAVDVAWLTLKSRCAVGLNSDAERKTLCDIVATKITVAASDHDLVRHSVAGFMAFRRKGPGFLLKRG